MALHSDSHRNQMYLPDEEDATPITQQVKLLNLIKWLSNQ